MEIKNKETIVSLNIKEKKQEDLYILGLNSTSSIHWVASLINRFLDTDLSYQLNIPVKDKSTISDSFQLFSNVVKEKNSLLTDKSIAVEDEDFFDISILDSEDTKIAKYWLIQSRGEYLYLYPKIKQMDYIFCSNYPLTYKKEGLKKIEEINYIFELELKNLGTKFKQIIQLIH